MLVWDVKIPQLGRDGVIEAYEMAPASIRRNDDVAFVCDCLMPEGVQGVAIRHYSFPDRYWAANISLDLDGTLITEFGPKRTFTYDCDITTPHFEAFGALCNVDLKLDVFMGPDAREPVVTDREDFEWCVANGWIDEVDRAGAERALADLLQMMERTDFVGFLDEVYPFGPLHDAAEVTILPKRSLAGVPVLEHWKETRSVV